jgi:NTE family protein
MPTRALVLGGGGPVGVAWEAGLVAGLEQEGVRLAEAGLIVGTSAGSIVGSQLALGRAPSALVEAQRTLNETQPARNTALSQVDTVAVVQHLRKWLMAPERTQEVRAEIGAFALAAKTLSEEEALAGFSSTRILESATWPDRYVCTAVDATDGTFVVWDKGSGVSLHLAVASSCAVPGIFPPITINGRRYMDGGMRSSTNADLALGYDRVVVVLVVPGIPGAVDALRKRIEPELEELRAAGSVVELIVPDAAVLEASGPNLLDPSRRAVIVEAGLRQGVNEAARLEEFWNHN